jgi:hypothetical protein
MSAPTQLLEQKHLPARQETHSAVGSIPLIVIFLLTIYQAHQTTPIQNSHNAKQSWARDTVVYPVTVVTSIHHLIAPPLIQSRAVSESHRALENAQH